MTQLEIKDLGIQFNENWIFKHLSVTVNQGEFVSILGTSGCGKSTLLNVLSGILIADKGQIFVNQQKIVGINDCFSYMPQEDLLFDWKTVKENITLYQTIHKEPIDDTLITHYLTIFGLETTVNHYPDELSGGMRQRVALLRTVLANRDILLLDEPFGALDVITRQHLQDWLKKIAKTLNKTIILVTHDIDEALYLSDRILILSDKPSHFVADIDLTAEIQTREWLANQGARRHSIFQQLK